MAFAFTFSFALGNQKVEEALRRGVYIGIGSAVISRARAFGTEHHTFPRFFAVDSERGVGEGELKPRLGSLFCYASR